jgi:hypothetical protein
MAIYRYLSRLTFRTEITRCGFFEIARGGGGGRAAHPEDKHVRSPGGNVIPSFGGRATAGP